MSTSTDAILFYGWPFDAEDTPPWQNDDDDCDDYSDEDWEDRLARLTGTSDVYEDRQRLLDEYGCTVGMHCSNGCIMYYVAVEASEMIAKRGYPEPVPKLEVGAEWPRKLTRFCELMGIKMPVAEPGWWLVSWYG